MIVLDASAAIELLLRRKLFETVASVIHRPRQVIHAPHVIDLEVTQVLRRLEKARVLEPNRAAEGLDDLRSLRIIRHSHTSLLHRAWTLRHSLSVYDAVYVALAEALEARLVTTDRRLASAPGHRAEVVLCS